MSKSQERYEWEVAALKEKAQEMAERMRSAADDLEREINRIDEGDMKFAGVTERASWAANSLLHLIPNLHVEMLLVKASRAEEWRLKAMYESVKTAEGVGDVK